MSLPADVIEEASKPDMMEAPARVAERHVKINVEDQLAVLNELAVTARHSDILQPKRYQTLLAKRLDGMGDDEFDDFLRKIHAEATGAMLKLRELFLDPLVFHFSTQSKTLQQYANAVIELQRAFAVYSFKDGGKPYRQGVIEQCLCCGRVVEAFLLAALAYSEGKGPVKPQVAAPRPR